MAKATHSTNIALVAMVVVLSLERWSYFIKLAFFSDGRNPWVENEEGVCCGDGRIGCSFWIWESNFPSLDFDSHVRWFSFPCF